MLVALFVILSLTWTIFGAPPTREIIDMTHAFDETMFKIKDPQFKNFKIDKWITGPIPGTDGLWKAEEYSSNSHSGTHIDVPKFMIRDGKSVDEIPIDALIGSAAVIDITAKTEMKPDAEVTIADLLQWEAITGQTLDGTIILLKSGLRNVYYGDLDGDLEKLLFPGFSPEAIQWLVDNRQIKGVGTEAFSIDASQKDFRAHNILLGSNGPFILENLANIDKIPIYGAKILALPMKIGKGTGAPTRVIAVIKV